MAYQHIGIEELTTKHNKNGVTNLSYGDNTHSLMEAYHHMGIEELTTKHNEKG
ncbi:unnamed protein product [Dovyalis caffra]|uniref:Uncharacterized protein n=1 Tax=Dovyalis caffra TaxID=77055 RepID=A0AAV1S1R5_9ROSI|nr:unnamed protein product [Dovyalis caffra]